MSPTPGGSLWAKASLWLCSGPSWIRVPKFHLWSEANSLQEQNVATAYLKYFVFKATVAFQATIASIPTELYSCFLELD